MSKTTACYLLRMFAESEFTDHIVPRFGARIVILYGSAARGETRPGSDIDVACFVNQVDRYPTSYLWRGLLVDAWIYPMTDTTNSQALLKLHDGRVLLDEDGLGQALLTDIAKALREPRQKLDEREERHRRAWIWKMFDRAGQVGVESDYRRHWLLFDLPETWCDLTQRHYLGPDSTLKTMEAEALPVYDAVRRALSAGSSLSEVELAVTAVVGARPPLDVSG
jgi:hypothetical protein